MPIESTFKIMTMEPVSFYLNGRKIGEYILPTLLGMMPELSHGPYETSEKCEFNSMKIEESTLNKLLGAVQRRTMDAAAEVFAEFSVAELLQCTDFAEEQGFKWLVRAIQGVSAGRISWAESLKLFARGEIALLPREQEEAIAANLDDVLQHTNYREDFVKLPIAQKWRIVQLSHTTPARLFEFVVRQWGQDPELCKLIISSHVNWEQTPMTDLDVLSQVPDVGDTEISVPLRHYMELRHSYDTLQESMPRLFERIKATLPNNREPQ